MNIILTLDYIYDINILTNKRYKVDSDNNTHYTTLQYTKPLYTEGIGRISSSLRLTQITSKFILIIIVFLAGNRSYTAPILQYTLNSTHYTTLHYTIQ